MTKSRSGNSGRAPRRPAAAQSASYWLYGLHPVRAALHNPRRIFGKLMATRNAIKNLSSLPFEPEAVERKVIDRLVAKDAVHQGVALEVDPLPEWSLEELLDQKSPDLVVVLDQVTDPHNVGAIMRSAAAFEAGAVITTWRHSPPETAVLAKSAAGALETVPYIRGQNLAAMLQVLQQAGFTIIGLDAGAPTAIGKVATPERAAIVLGAEGKGMRRRTAGLCDILARLPISEQVESLNVSNAAAIALYALRSG